MNRTLIRVAAILVFGAAAAAGVFAYRTVERSRHEAAYLAELLADLSRIDAGGADRAEIERLAREAHAEAIGRAFTPSGLTGGVYDVNLYQRTAVDLMIARARESGRRDLADKLESFKHEATLDLSGSSDD